MGLPGSIQGHLGKKQAAPEQQSAAPQVLFTSHVTMSQAPQGEVVGLHPNQALKWVPR